MEIELKPNELYRGYTIVSMVENPGEVRILDSFGDYIQVCGKAVTFDSFDHAKANIDCQIRNGSMFAIEPRRAKAVSAEHGLQLVVSTPGGDIVAKSCGDTDYPDVSIFIHGHCVAFVEWNPDSKQFNLQYYGSSDDEPKATFENITE